IAILLGANVFHHPKASLIRYIIQEIASLTQASVGYLTDGANSAGAWLAGAIPHRHAGGCARHHSGLSAYQMLEKARQAYILFNVEPDLDCANPSLAVSAMQQAKCVIALS